jgi:hypothetical protein
LPPSTSLSATPRARQRHRQHHDLVAHVAGTFSAAGAASMPGMSNGVPSGSTPLAEAMANCPVFQRRAVEFLLQGGEPGAEAQAVAANPGVQLAGRGPMFLLLEVLGLEEHALRPQDLVLPSHDERKVACIPVPRRSRCRRRCRR